MFYTKIINKLSFENVRFYGNTNNFINKYA